MLEVDDPHIVQYNLNYRIANINMINNQWNRNQYIDVLRAVGLILLIGVHVNAPGWYKQIRTFDVPLMVFVSALCYKPAFIGYAKYSIKRFRRIYIPVFIFLCFFFIGYGILHLCIGTILFTPSTILGSFCLLNEPSIGYVWIMRVFLLIALVIPCIEICLRKVGYYAVVSSLLGIIILQESLIYGINEINNHLLVQILDEIVLYIVGYSPFVVLGLKIRTFNKQELILFICICGIIMLWVAKLNFWIYLPNKGKYPPSSTYILYGLFVCTLLWSLRDIKISSSFYKVSRYLSQNSMWIYLWHIVPVYIVKSYSWVANTWFLRCMIVMISTIIIFEGYVKLRDHVPESIRKYLE